MIIIEIIRIVAIVFAASATGVIIVVSRAPVIIEPVGIVAIPPGGIIIKIPASGIVRVVAFKNRIAPYVAVPVAYLFFLHPYGIDLLCLFCGNRVRGLNLEELVAIHSGKLRIAPLHGK
jgi:hypothetical protein